VRCRVVDHLVNGAQCDPWADVKLACDNGFDGMDQLFTAVYAQPFFLPLNFPISAGASFPHGPFFTSLSRKKL